MDPYLYGQLTYDVEDKNIQWGKASSLHNVGETEQLHAKEGFPSGSLVKNLPTNAGDVGLIPGLGRFPGEGNGNPLQYSCLWKFKGQGSLVGYSSWGSQKSWTRLSN